MIYSSTKNEFIKSIKKLQEKKYRDSTATFLVEGEHLVIEAIKNNCVKYIITEENYEFKSNIRQIKVTNNVLKYISSLDNPQPIMAVCKKLKNELLDDKILILDDIQDPGNLGTIIRSCVAFGFNTLVVSKNTVDTYNSKVIRASQGMIFSINIIVADLETFICDLKSKGYYVIGTDVESGKSVSNFKNFKKSAIIMGNEGNGLSKKIKQLCDECIYIPISDCCESLNVGVAASIIMYELR